MAPKKKTRTTVGEIHPDALAYTAGRDIELDAALVEADCLGTAAHVTMLSRMPIRPLILGKAEAKRVVRELVAILRDHESGRFPIRLADQDVHLAVERRLTRRLGDLGRKVHTGRSRNDQVALDLRLFGKETLLDLHEKVAELIQALLNMARKHVAIPMVGRTHMQKAMPSSVGLWASAHAEALLDDVVFLMTAYDLNDQNPLGSAAGYGVPLPIDRDLVTRLLGLSRTMHNVLHAGNARGKNESYILQAAGQVMVTLSCLAQDLVLFSMPEFGYFTLPPAYGTGSSIMPQKTNPDVLELVRARAARVLAHGQAVLEIIRSSPSGYNRDVQEVKAPFLEGLAMTLSSVAILKPIVEGIQVHRDALEAGFSPDVFAADRALELAAQGMPFRSAYQQVKRELASLEHRDPYHAMARKDHLGATAGLDFDGLDRRAGEVAAFVKEDRKAFHKALGGLLGVRYPLARAGDSRNPTSVAKGCNSAGSH
jgi:argininosuccinate lyase